MEQQVLLKDIKDESVEDLIKTILIDHKSLSIKLPDGEEIIIQAKTRLKPLPSLNGYIPDGWKEAIYDE
jgi:hypothetical protein